MPRPLRRARPGWAMICAGRCAEALEDWATAERYSQQISMGYPEGSWPVWFLLCKRTGHGDLKSAREFAESAPQIDQRRPQNGQSRGGWLFSWLNGDTQKALTCFRQAHRSAPDAYTCFNLIVLADEIGDNETRERPCESCSGIIASHAKACQVYEILRRDFPRPGETGIRRLECDRGGLRGVSAESRSLNCWLVGCTSKTTASPRTLVRIYKPPASYPGFKGGSAHARCRGYVKLAAEDKANRSAAGAK